MNFNFCRKCGSTLLIQMGELYEYDRKDGIAIHYAFLVCPKKIISFDGHDRWRGHMKDGSNEFKFEPVTHGL